MIIGIDLGTSTAEAAALKNGKPIILKNADGEKIIPSVVGIDDDGNFIVGKSAADQLLIYPDRTVAEVKRLIGSDKMIILGGKEYTPVEISAKLLAYIKDYAEKGLGESVDSAVITVPAYFDDIQRRALVEAGKKAGFKVERIINEPTAAALCYGIDHMGDESHILVYDLGGGTFDVTLLKMISGMLEVKASSGNNKLGGKDFDERIMQYIIIKFKNKHEIDLSLNVYAMVKLKAAAQKCKIALSTEFSYNIVIPMIAEKNGIPLAVDETITVPLFENIIKDLIKKTSEPIKIVLNDSGVEKSDIDLILLVGGSTRIPAVKQYVAKLLGKIPIELVDPDLSVAMGAAVQAGILDETISAEKGIMITDVNPYALGIRSSLYFWDTLFNDHMSVIIPRNITVPVTKNQIFATASDSQTEVIVAVYQGDKRTASENSFLGNFKIMGIPSAKAGKEKINIEFSYDVNGLLTVKGTIISTGKKVSIDIDMAGIGSFPFKKTDVSGWKSAVKSVKYLSVINKGERFLNKAKLGDDIRNDLECSIYDLKLALIDGRNSEFLDDLVDKLLELINEI